jgi:hypothetical protein
LLGPGCGTIPLNKKVPDFSPSDDLLATALGAVLFRRDTGRIRSALDLR